MTTRSALVVHHRLVECFLTAALRNDIDGAFAIAREACGTGGFAAAARVMADAQRALGERWLQGARGPAVDQTATSVAERVSSMIADDCARPGGRGDVLVVTAEGEWHAAPARLLSDGLRVQGWDVWCVAGSANVEDLAALLVAERPVAVALSATRTASLPAALRTVHAVHRAGVPVLAGGAAFGVDSARAQALGADGWAPDTAAADALLAQWALGAPVVAAARLPMGMAIWQRLLAERGPLLDHASAALGGLAPDAAHVDAATAELGELLDLLGVAVLVGDHRVVAQHLVWRTEFLRRRRRLDRAVMVAALALDEALAAARLWMPLDELSAAWVEFSGAGAVPHRLPVH